MNQEQLNIWKNAAQKSDGFVKIYAEDLLAIIALAERAAPPAQALVYPPDGTVSPFTVINLGHGQVKMGDSIHAGRLPALWFGKDGLGMGIEQVMNRAASDGETLAVVTFSNVEGLDVLAEVVQRIRRISFPGAQAVEAVAQAKIPSGLIERIEAAEARIQNGHSLRRIPADPTDVDLVLAEVRLWLEGRHDKAIWIKPQATHPAQAKPNADCSGEPANCPDNEGYGCACDPMNKAANGAKNG